jgi:hypothetical protein
VEKGWCDLLELARLVAAVGEARVAVLAFGVDGDFATEGLGDAGKVLDRGGAEGEDLARDAREGLGEVDGRHFEKGICLWFESRDVL